jgi:hypothetical protein
MNLSFVRKGPSSGPASAVCSRAGSYSVPRSGSSYSGPKVSQRPEEQLQASVMQVTSGSHKIGARQSSHPAVQQCLQKCCRSGLHTSDSAQHMACASIEIYVVFPLIGVKPRMVSRLGHMRNHRAG